MKRMAVLTVLFLGLGVSFAGEISTQEQALIHSIIEGESAFENIDSLLKLRAVQMNLKILSHNVHYRIKKSSMNVMDRPLNSSDITAYGHVQVEKLDGSIVACAGELADRTEMMKIFTQSLIYRKSVYPINLRCP